MPRSATRTLLAIPVFNEQRYVARVLGEVRRYARDILVIDDGSTDETPMLLARQPVDVIRHARNRGYGRSMVDAFRWAQCYGFDWLITMDCDEQHEPASLPDFFKAIERDDADVISGSRYLRWREDTRAAAVPAVRSEAAQSNRGTAGTAVAQDATEQSTNGDDMPPSDRRAINQTITARVNETLGLSLTDAFCGFKAYRTSAIRKLELAEPGYAFPLQFWVQAAAKDLRISELPIRLIYNDPNRSFGGPLDNAEARLAHYLEVFERELAKFPDRFPAACCQTCRTRPADDDSDGERLSEAARQSA